MLAAGTVFRRGGEGESFFFDADVGVDVGIGGPDAGVAEPEGDHGGVDAGLQQLHCAAVTHDVWVDALAEQ